MTFHASQPTKDSILDHPLVNAQARQQSFTKLVIKDSIYHHPKLVQFSFALPDEKMHQLARYPNRRDLLDTKVHNWLGNYFPDAQIIFGSELGTVKAIVDGQERYVPTIRVNMRGEEAIQRFDAFMRGETILPDYQHLVHELNSDAGRQEYLLGRVAEEPKQFKGALAGQVHVDFSVPHGYGGALEDEFFEQYGKAVKFKSPKENGLMVTVGATLKGETAKQFMSDYNHYKGRE